MNRLTILTLGLKAFSCAAILAVLTLMLVSSPAHAAQENAGYSAPALFNQGNAFARAGKTGQAILAYERAHLLAPDDPDIAANEHFVRAHAGMPDAPENRFARYFSFASPNALAWLGCLGLAMLGLGALLARLLPKRRNVFRMAVAAGMVFIVFAIGSAVFAWPKMSEAVVIAHEAPARISPATVAEAAYKLREGEIVTVNAEVPEFALVQNAAGRPGWVARADLARVVPAGE